MSDVQPWQRRPPRPAPLLARAPEVAALLDMSLASFRSAKRNLLARGFPPPVPGLGKRWDVEAIRDWLASQRAPKDRAAEPPLDDIAAWQREIDRRLGYTG
jgi:predicted DNA-binding transcriptional regulator AlpA